MKAVGKSKKFCEKKACKELRKKHLTQVQREIDLTNEAIGRMQGFRFLLEEARNDLFNRDQEIARLKKRLRFKIETHFKKQNKRIRVMKAQVSQ